MLRLLFLFFLIFFLTAGFYLYKAYKLEKKIIQISNTENTTIQKSKQESTILSAAKQLITSDYKPLKGEDRNRINVLLLGMGGEGHSGKYLTDTIMIASVNPQTLETALLSIPRDLYVNIPETNIYTKINAVYSYELLSNKKDSAKASESIKKVVEEVTGQKIDYYFSLDFEGFIKIIDEIGGITVDVPEDIFDSRYPGPNFSYQTFEVKKGTQFFNGETALKYARVRHTTGGDFARASRQQAIIASTKKKAFSIETIINPYKIGNIMDTLGENLKTDVKFEEIPSFLKILENINIHQTTNKVLDAWSKDSLLAVSHVSLGGVRAFILIPRFNNYKEIHELAENIFQANYIEKQKEEIEKENAQILTLIPEGNNLIKTKSILNSIGYKSLEIQSNNEKFNEICNNKTIIINNQINNYGSKLFTMNDLVKKLETTTEDKTVNIEKDVIICLNTKTINYFESQISNSDNLKNEMDEQSVIDKNGNLLFNNEKGF